MMMNEKDMELLQARVEKVLNLPIGAAKYQTITYLIGELVKVIEDERSR